MLKLLCIILSFIILEFNSIAASLFTLPTTSIHSNSKSYTELYELVSQNINVDDGNVLIIKPLEERISEIIKSYPMLVIQSFFSIFIIINFLVDIFQYIPTKFIHKLRIQSCIIIILIKLVDILKTFNIADFNIRDTYSEDELYDEAKLDITKLIKSKESQIIAFYLLCLIIKCPIGLIPIYIIHNIPIFIRLAIIISLVILPKQFFLFKYPTKMIKWLFYQLDIDNEDIDIIHNKDKYNTSLNNIWNLVTIDYICSIIASVAEMITISIVFIDILIYQSKNQLSGIQDIFYNIIKLIIIQNYMLIKFQYIIRSLNTWRDTELYNNIKSSEIIKQILNTTFIKDMKLIYHTLHDMIIKYVNNIKNLSNNYNNNKEKYKLNNNNINNQTNNHLDIDNNHKIRIIPHKYTVSTTTINNNNNNNKDKNKTINKKQKNIKKKKKIKK